MCFLICVSLMSVLNGSSRFLLNHDCAIPNAATGNDVADANFHNIATAQLAVDRAVEKRSIHR